MEDVLSKLAIRVERPRYLELLRELRAIAHEMGFQVFIRSRPVIMNRYGCEGPNFGEIRGFASMRPDKRLVVTRFGRVARRKLLAYLAHETRHAQHVALGLYPGYYEPNVNAQNFLEGKELSLPYGFVLPDLDVALAAERDCDAWSETFLRERGIEPPAHVYAMEQTWSYATHQWIARKCPELYLSLPGAAPERLRPWDRPRGYETPQVASVVLPGQHVASEAG